MKLQSSYITTAEQLTLTEAQIRKTESSLQSLESSIAALLRRKQNATNKLNSLTLSRAKLISAFNQQAQ